VIRPDGEVNLPNGTPVEFHPVRRDMAAEIERADHLARNPPTLDELTEGVKPFRSLDDLPKVWPDDDDVDEFIRSIRDRK